MPDTRGKPTQLTLDERLQAVREEQERTNRLLEEHGDLLERLIEVAELEAAERSGWPEAAHPIAQAVRDQNSLLKELLDVFKEQTGWWEAAGFGK